MGLFDDLQKSTKTPEEVRQYEKDLQVRKRLNALNERLEHIKKSIIEETKSAANKGKRVVTIRPYHMVYLPDSNSYCKETFFITPREGWKIKGHHLQRELSHRWEDLYAASELDFDYGFIIAEDRPYIIEKTEEFLRAEGFKFFSVEYANVYLHPNRKIFKSPTGKVLQVQIMW